jgi:hypothetical protein
VNNELLPFHRQVGHTTRIMPGRVRRSQAWSLWKEVTSPIR